MKYFFLSLLLSVASVSSICAQTTKTITLRYSPDDFNITCRDSLVYLTSTTLTCTYGEDTSAPALPYLGINVLIANNMDYDSHSISYTERTILENVLIAPNTISIPTNFDGLFRRTSSVHYGRTTYPETIVSYSGAHVIGGYKLLSFSICPFKYDVTQKKLSLITGITINLTLSTSVAKNLVNTKHNPNATESIRRLIVNPQDISETIGNRTSTQNDEYEYLIITVDSFKSEFQRLANWKTTKGVRTNVKTVEEIYDEYANSQWNRPQQKIKQAIMDFYEDSNQTLQYVLLAGDHQYVPTEHCFAILYPKTGLIAADLYYASLKEVNWDKNHDGGIGATSDQVDLANDIIVTRLSVNNVVDAHSQIDRIIEYESNPNINDWEDKILLSGNTLDDMHYQYYPGEPISDTHYKCETFLYPNYIQSYWSNGSKYMFYDTGTSFEGGRLYHFRVGNIQEQFANKYTFFNVVTHGGVNYWAMEYRNDYEPHKQLYFSTDALDMQNNGYTIITTSACLTNGFSNDTTDCLGESFMRNVNGGIMGYYGCTEKGWSDSDSLKENDSEKHLGVMYKALFTDNRHQIGRAVYDAKRAFLNDCNTNSVERWLCLGMTLLGDPEMPVFLSQPQKFNNISLSYHNHILSVNTNTPNCRICITSKDDYGESYYEVIDSLSSHTFTLPSGTYRLCISKYGYIPYVVTVADSLYIQNETISSDMFIIADQIHVGSHVTNNKPQGPVTISNGAVKIKSSNGVEIVNDFQVLPDATLEINP